MEEQSGKKVVVLSKQAYGRMPYYLHLLREMKDRGEKVVSSTYVANEMNLNVVQVRKDFAAVSTSKGKPKAGFDLNELIGCIENTLGYNNVDEAVLVGVGSLGMALLSYKGFDDYGMKIVCAFDANKALSGIEVAGKKIFEAERISELCKRLNVPIGIITVPASEAQTVCDQLVAGGIKAIWNFAPVHLSTPEGILVQNENMAASLSLLSKHLKENLR